MGFTCARRRIRESAARRWSLVAVVALLLTGWLSACSAGPSNQTLTMLAIAPTNGENAALGASIMQAVALAVKQNASPGGGYTLTVQQLDESNAAIGQEVAQAVKNPQVVGAVGPFSSQVAVAALPALAQAGVATISPTVMLPGLTQADQATAEGLTFSLLHPTGKPNVFFRMTPDDAVAGSAAADLALASTSAHGLGAHAVFVVDDGTLSAKAQVASFDRELKAKHGVVAGSRTDMQNDPLSVQATVSAIIDAGPDSVFFAGDTQLGAMLRSTLTLTGVPQLPLLTVGPAANNPAWSDMTGRNALLFAGTSDLFPAPDLTNMPNVQSFVTAYKAAYPGQLVSPQSALAYDAAMDEISAIKALIAAKNTPSRAAVAHAVATGAYAGVTGKIAFDANGDPATATTFALYTSTAQGSWTYQASVAIKPPTH